MTRKNNAKHKCLWIPSSNVRPALFNSERCSRTGLDRTAVWLLDVTWRRLGFRNSAQNSRQHTCCRPLPLDTAWTYLEISVLPQTPHLFAMLNGKSAILKDFHVLDKTRRATTTCLSYNIANGRGCAKLVKPWSMNTNAKTCHIPAESPQSRQGP